MDTGTVLEVTCVQLAIVAEFVLETLSVLVDSIVAIIKDLFSKR